MKRIALIITLLLSACAGNGAASTGGADQQYTLRLNLKPGQHWTTNTNGTIHQEISMLPSASTSMTSTSTTDYTVLDVDAAGSTVMAMIITRVRSDTRHNSQITHTDSDTDVPDTLGGPFLVNWPLTLTLTPQGAITQYAGLDALLMDLRGFDAGEELPADDQATMQSEAEMVQDSVSQSMGRAMIFPEQPVEIGDSWTQSMSLNMDFGRVDVNLTYTLREVTSAGLVIEIAGTDRINQVQTSDPGIGMVAQQTQIDMILTLTGAMVLDPETFWGTQQHIDLVLEGTITQSMVSPMSEPLSENETPDPDSAEGPSRKSPMKQTITMDIQVQK